MADSEVNQFLKELAGEQPESILDKPLDLGEKTDEEPEKETPAKRVELDEDGYLKNRQGRRKRQEDERLRDEISQLNERVRQLSEVDKFKQEFGDDHLKKVEAIFGTDTPEKLAATNLLKEALQGMTEKAKAEALQEIESRGEVETRAQREADSEVDEFLEMAEDEGLDVSDDSVRSGLITLMERMSKKYDDGNIKEFADNEAVIETYLALQKRGGSNRAKELADRSMTRSGESQPSTLPQNAIERYMEEHGLAW
jgi:hypothetical protein